MCCLLLWGILEILAWSFSRTSILVGQVGEEAEWKPLQLQQSRGLVPQHPGTGLLFPDFWQPLYPHLCWSLEWCSEQSGQVE